MSIQRKNAVTVYEVWFHERGEKYRRVVSVRHDKELDKATLANVVHNDACNRFKPELRPRVCYVLLTCGHEDMLAEVEHLARTLDAGRAK